MSESFPPHHPEDPADSAFENWKHQFTEHGETHSYQSDQGYNEQINPPVEEVFDTSQADAMNIKPETDEEKFDMPSNLEGLRDYRNRLGTRVDRILTIAEQTGDNSLIQTPWFNFVAGKLSAVEDVIAAMERAELNISHNRRKTDD